MRNQGKDNFRTKFILLNSQRSSEEITWSCSDSSDYENTSNDHNEICCQNKQSMNRKRKRVNNKKKSMHNISNLNIEYSNSQLQQLRKKEQEKSTIIEKPTNHITSPILTNLQQPLSNISNSPVLQCGTKLSSYVDEQLLTSPILTSKHASPKPLPKVRKKLFTNNNSLENKHASGILEMNPAVLIKSEINPTNCTSFDNNLNRSTKVITKLHVSDHKIINTVSNKSNAIGDNEVKVDNGAESVNSGQEVCDNISVTSTSSLTLVNKVKSYFDSHFSSETPSQQSISEYETTPKNSSKTSEEIEFINSLPEPKILPQSVKQENRSSSDSLSLEENINIQKSRKIRYKKDGLAYRLSLLTKKQKANISLWQHERFLAANSNFAIPNEKFSAFRVRKVFFQYGCYLLEAMDIEESKYLIVINNGYVNNVSIEVDSIFKLYKPYKIIDCDRDYKLVVNVCKFECTVLKK